ncbi:MAG: hypothetical protein ACREJT_11800, partial [Myxococcota bacterium]
LRTYTQGDFWEQYPEVLSGASYLPPGNPAAAVTALGAPTAPCAEPTSLSVQEDAAALVCDNVPYLWMESAGAGWVEIPAAPARSVLISNGTLTLARATAECDGIAVSTTPVVDPSAFQTSCQAGLDPASAIALAAGPDGVLMWSGDSVNRL